MNISDSLVPDIAGALFILIVGFLVARLLRIVSHRLSDSFNSLISGRLDSSTLEFVRISNTAKTTLGAFFFWATMVVFIAITVRFVGFTGAAGWLESIVSYLPSLFAGGLLVLAGVVLGSIAFKLVVHAAAAANIEQSRLLGKLSQTSFIFIGLVLGLDQVGIDVTFIIILFGIPLTAIMMGFALAFGLAAKPLLENLIANQHLKQLVKIRQRISCKHLDGIVVEFTATGIVLETDEGRLLMPAKWLMEEGLNLIDAEASDEHS